MREERQAKVAMAVRLRRAGWSFRRIADELGVSHQTARLWCMDAAKVFREEAREKAKCRPKTAVGKKKPRQLITLSGPWWREAPAVVRVDIITGQILAFRWPLE
ncbi:Homeodomain-like domain-containing protein [Desulfofundulus australicus DSM 11792]|uniref:Homeodomain-like domain-containing protein n=1 Tax=Desulfofundulus australicus DSM 11792 TaxID=1121425 RepID=A0A1M5DQ71_9FIRM|nr:helix-turn-helix domain-containing protein [Desulfofundulus australicus]SHF69139.1 Homeodomain-like domain-containing protein [Desulfofundulus australicus DSM 11792]